MTPKNRTIRVFTGSEVAVNKVKGELEKRGIPSIVKNDFNSGIVAGFGGGIPTAIDLYIQEKDLKEATPIIRGLMHAEKR